MISPRRVPVLLLALGFAVAAPPAHAQARAGWITHKDPGGFAVQHPPGWRVRSDATSGQVLVEGTAGERLVIWPFFVRAAADQRAAGTILMRLAQQLRPDLRWPAPRPVGPLALRTQAQAGGQAAVASLTLAGSQQGTAGYFYLAVAPEKGIARAGGTFADIVRTFSVAGTASGADIPAIAPVSYVRWQDPNESAFSTEVPRGWAARGGLVRRAAVDVSAVVQVAPPDGQVQLYIGDAAIPKFVLPNPTLQATGFPEGAWYSPGYGVRMLVRRFQRGSEFAREYAARAVSGRCAELTFAQSRDRPDAARGVNAILARHGPGLQQRLDMGEVAFMCRSGTQAMAGYAFAGTMATQAGASLGGEGVWSVEHLYGFLALRDRAPQAQTILAHMVESFRLNPEWVRMQQGLTANVSGIVAETGAYVAKVFSDAYWSSQKAGAEMSRRRSNQILELEDVVDPATGRATRVESGANYYWVDQRGNIVGTQTHTRPSIDFRELVRLP